MQEIFDIISDVNLLVDHVKHHTIRIDNLCKNPALIAFDKYVNEKTAGKLLHISPAELRKMSADGEITFIRHHRKVLYHIDTINQYLADNTVKAKERA
jgi:hypothetical protein